MRAGLVLLAGCNAVFGLEATKPAPTDGPVALCDPLPFDAHRYMSDQSGAAGFNWGDARTDCKKYGFDLAVINANDNLEITNELQGAPLPFWLGVSYDGTDWIAIDGCMPLLAWGPGQPMSPKVGDCLLQDQGGMVTFDCTGAFAGPGINALCETPRPNPQCRIFAAERDYVVLTATVTSPVSHDAGEQMCSAMGRHLVEIDSSDELDFLRTNHPDVPSFWLGATTNLQTWSSPTSCPQVFTWATGEPDMVNTCSFIDAAGMHAAPCNQPAVVQSAVICELNAAS